MSNDQYEKLINVLREKYGKLVFWGFVGWLVFVGCVVFASMILSVFVDGEHHIIHPLPLTALILSPLAVLYVVLRIIFPKNNE